MFSEALLGFNLSWRNSSTRKKQKNKNPLIPPFIVSVAERPDRDGEGLPHWVQGVLHHLRLVADGESGHKHTQIRGKIYIKYISKEINSQEVKLLPTGDLLLNFLRPRSSANCLNLGSHFDAGHRLHTHLTKKGRRGTHVPSSLLL